MEITVINRTNRTMTDLSVELSVTGSFKLPPAGDTVPINVMEPTSPLFKYT